MSGWKIGTRSKLLIAALGLVVMVGCVPVSHGYYDPYPYGGYSGYSGGAVVLNYQSYGRPHYGPRYRDHGRGHRHWH